MATNLPVLSDKDLNRAKNKKVTDEALPFIYETVIAWGCQKENHETFLAYYNRREKKIWDENKEDWEKEVEEILEKNVWKKKWTDEKIVKETEKQMKKLKEERMKKLVIKETWKKEDELHLNQVNCDGLDVTFLHRLLPTICDGIIRYNPDSLSSTKIEEYLREIKNKRNDISHDPKRSSVSSTMLDEIEVSGIKVFEAAGVLYSSSVKKQSVQDKIDEFKKMLQTIKEEVMTDEQHRIQQTAKKMANDGMSEMQEAIMLQTEDKLPLSEHEVTRRNVFHPMDLSKVTDQEGDSNDANTNTDMDNQINREISCFEFLTHFESNNVLIEGQPGAGKTTLLKMLREDFLSKREERFHSIKKFDLVLYMECRSNSITTIYQLLEQQFPKTFQQLDKDEAVKALRVLNILICVDGLDELTSQSKGLLQELSRKFGHQSNSTFIFTSRPGRAISVSLNYQRVTIQPIINEIQQVNFLQRYKENVKGLKDSDVIKAFWSLNEKCKAFLCHPIKLALFCALYKKSPETIKKWNNEINLMNDFLRVSKLTMIERMNSMNLNNPDCLAEKVTNAMFELSVCLLQKQQMTFTLKTYNAMCQDIFDLLDVPYYAILSLFITKHADQQTFYFFHKSSMEFLAAKAIEQMFLTNPSLGVICTIDTILNVRRAWINDIYDDNVPAADTADGANASLVRYNNVIRFVIMMMAEGGPSKKKTLKIFLNKVCPVLAEEKIAFSFWVELVLSCHACDEVVQAAAQVSIRHKVWRIVTAHDMMAVIHMLRFHQPARLDIRSPLSESHLVKLKLLLEAVAQWHNGQLDLYLSESFISFAEIDDLVNSLDSKESVTFTLRQFRGCLGPNKAARQILVSAVKRAETTLPDFDIALTNPRQHLLEGLEGTRHWLYILAQLNPCESSLRCPLPQSSVRPPEMSVNCRLVVEEDVVDKTAALIVDLAPQEGQYHLLSLQQWAGTDYQLDELLQKLSDAGVSTTGHGPSWWEPHGADSDGRCNACLSVHQDGWGRCVQLVVPGPDPTDTGAVRRVYRDDMREVTNSLPYDPISWLDVRTMKGEDPPLALAPLMDAVAVWHKGKLEVNLFHSFHDFVPVDEFLARLDVAECKLVSFVGCLKGDSWGRAWLALVKLVRRAEEAELKQVLAISLMEPWQHRLGELEGTRHSLEIRVHLPSSLRNQHPRPLPTSTTHHPWLTVECRPAGGAPKGSVGTQATEETSKMFIATLIEDLAPKDRTYRVLYLQHFPGTNDTLNGIVERLTAFKVSTTGGGTACWTVSKKDDNESCWTCLEMSHRPGERCVRLRLP